MQSFLIGDYTTSSLFFILNANKFLQALFGNDIRIKEGSFFIGTKHADDFGDMDDDELAKQEDLDVSTCKITLSYTFLFESLFLLS